MVLIAYSEEFRDTFDYFRAILKSKEVSERAFQLTTDAAALNPANYTVWSYRRMILKNLDMDLMEELKYITKVIEEHPKNYQVWYHRVMVVTWLADASAELGFTAAVLQMDGKNYHAWQHRQWALKTFELWNGELAYLDRLLTEDVMNNSAWNHRYFVVGNTTGFTDEVADREFKYVKDQIQRVPHNESTWNYLRGILSDSNKYAYPGLVEFCEGLYKNNVRSFYLMGFMVECWQDGIEKAGSESEKAELLGKAVDFCESLAEDHDTIRVEYWKYVSRSLSFQHSDVKVVEATS